MPAHHPLLGLLARGPRYGYELRRELEAEFGAEWRLDFGQLYRALAALRAQQWVAARTMSGDKGPARRVYAITPRGRVELRRWLKQPATPRGRGRDELPIKLRLGAATPGVGVHRLVAERRRALTAQRATHRRAADHAQAERDPARWLISQSQLHHVEGALDALEGSARLLPARRTQPAEPATTDIVMAGSDDLVVDLLGHHLTAAHPDIRFTNSPVGSLSGLLALREGQVHAAGIHLLDQDSGEYNLPFVKHLLPEDSVILLHLARREQGLIVAAGNPKRIRGVKDLCRRSIRLINRQRGAGTRLFLLHCLRRARVDPRSIAGFDRSAPTHHAVAAAIAAGTADVGPGVRAVAEAWGLDFIPLGDERYDLSIPRVLADSPRFRPLLEVIHQRAFRRAAAALSGYDVSRLGTIVATTH